MGRPHRILVIGASPTAGLLHLPVLARLRDQGRIVLGEICDIQRDRSQQAKAHFGFSRESGDAYAALQRPDIDIVYLFGSAQLHYHYGHAALACGKHLFVEKPIASSYAEAMVLVEQARLRGRIAAGGLNRRFYRSLLEIHARRGDLGWRFAEATFHKAVHGQPAPFGARTWLTANGIHALDALVYMMGGLPEQLNAIAQGAGGTPTAFSALMRWPGGAQAAFLCNNDAGERQETYAFHGIGESYRVSNASLLIERTTGSETIALPGVEDGFAAEHGAFLASIETGLKPIHGLSALAPSLFLAQLIEDGFCGPVRLPPPPMASAHPRASLAASATAILVINPARLRKMVTSELLKYPLVPITDLDASTDVRPDIVAALIGPGEGTFQDALLAKLPNLSAVGLVGLSYARHAHEALATRGVALFNASGAYADSVAEYAMGLAILARRRGFISNRVMRQGGWGTNYRPSGAKAIVGRAARAVRPIVQRLGLEPRLLRAWRRSVASGSEPTGAPRDLNGAVVGLIGWGLNARAFCERLLEAGAHVLVYSGHASPQDIERSGAKSVSLDEVLAAEIVSLHRGLTAATRHGIGAAELAKLRPGTVLINVARGALIEPRALLARLKRGDIFACLDTFEDEPPERSHPLRKLSNVFLSAHIAGGSVDGVAAGETEVIGKLLAYLNGRPVEPLRSDRLVTMT